MERQINLTDEERELIIACLGLRQQFVQQDGIFTKFSDPPKNTKPKYPRLAIDQMRLIMDIENLRNKLQ